MSNSKERRLNLNKLFARILIIGVTTFFIVIFILFKQEQKVAAERWRLDSISKSLSNTSSYYTSLVTGVILNKKNKIDEILKIASKSENLKTIDIVQQSALTKSVLETCKINYHRSFFNQVPTCYEYKNNFLTIYHELRSAGHNLGYLAKTIKQHRTDLFGNMPVFWNALVVVFCFVSVIVIVLFYLKRFVIKPIHHLTGSILNNQVLSLDPMSCSLDEISLLASSLKNYLISIERYEEKTRRLEVEAKFVQLARQVAHDIRSPLAALSIATEFVKKLPEEERTLIRSAIQRIGDIANDLSGKKIKKDLENETAQNQKKLSVELLPSLIDSLVSEKRVQYRSRLELNIESKLDSSSYGLFAKIQIVQLKCVLSNLVNNAVEAMGEKGKIFVSLKTRDDIIQITVFDNGRGIPKEILPQLMQEGATFGKEKDKQSGSGLGLYHARESVKLWGGDIEIKSDVGQGTDVIITLPRAESPDWFVSKIEISETTKVVILDDDDSIHQIWKNRFSEIKFKKENVFHFRTAEDVRKKFLSEHVVEEEFLFLFDYELLGSKLTGLDLIEELNIAKNAILVTSHFEEQDVRALSVKLGVKLLPKNLAGFVPIVLSPLTPALRTYSHEGKGESNDEFVLIDDEDMNHVVWKTLAAMKKKKLSTFYSPAEFFKQMGKFDKSTNIYIDSNLQNGLKGELVAKMIHKKGFEKIYLCTGHSPQDFPQDMPWITGIVGKVPPFGEE